MKFCFLAEAIVYRYIARAKSEISQKLVGSSGLEPPTSRLSGVRSNHLSYEPVLSPSRLLLSSLACDFTQGSLAAARRLPLAFAFPAPFALPVLSASSAFPLRITSPANHPSAAGGDEQIRTVDPLLARQVLSQLSYTPVFPKAAGFPSPAFPTFLFSEGSKKSPGFPSPRFPWGPSKLNNDPKTPNFPF